VGNQFHPAIVLLGQAYPPCRASGLPSSRVFLALGTLSGYLPAIEGRTDVDHLSLRGEAITPGAPTDACVHEQSKGALGSKNACVPSCPRLFAR
jgi:hypothetical protein